MPPVTKAGGEQFRKDVEFVSKNDDEQIATGIVMVPDAVDRQYDFVHEDTIREFADQFETFVDAGEAGGGIMHAVFPDEWMDLERNEVLDEAEEIGGTEAPAGAWVQEWRINHADLWQLIVDEIIAGYSIGAIDVGWNGPFEQDEVDDLTVPDEIGDDALVWELVSGIIREVSAVDIPAVPDAQILETKAHTEKRLGDYLGDPEGFLEEAQQRGHSEEEAERMWDVLSEAAQVEGSSEPGKISFFERVGKAAFNAVTGSDAGTESPDAADDSSATRSAPSSTDSDEPPTSVPRSVKTAAAAVKEGRTLSRANRNRLFATIDASVDVLEDAGVEHGIDRFTDREDWDFDLSEHEAGPWETGDDDDDEEGFWELAVVDGVEGYQHSETGEFVPVGEATVDIISDAHSASWAESESGDNHAAGGDTPDDDTTMSDNPGDEDLKDLVEQQQEQISELTQAVSDITETIAGPQPKTAEIEIDGETYEVPESQVKAALGVDEDAGVGLEDAIKTLQEKADRVDEVEQRLDLMNQQSGVSTQLEGNTDADKDAESDSGLDSLAKSLS
ncbi:XkdF-like putative serine protease domain-containing protein [Natronobacterium gregoryi]|uniref:Phage-like element PBSX protein XkdF domain-containing protein n=2 Tax=Natronobacterium gregoryi TaxID=44930 RepID=L0AM66_NATGS|nr:XkdF-like putative serine protease domain-containing protein [Natronobacterium gregoryi]AFZ74554.1 hypothetical protein Natgr_3435 [Natronobacterium gregoryi SP2]ELY72376.1 hypothetical protein C490_03493 [Natronobacterium gregoryi SP2]PLK21704.1 hypothetical protein CYV19_02385 [Natronobacterium gregoryi SP2]SFI96358.1 Putative phage serine protease XkdF [Natronobacterium gregoryi]